MIVYAHLNLMNRLIYSKAAIIISHVNTVLIPTLVHAHCSTVIRMIDEVFWIQVKAAWSQKCDVRMADKKTIENDSPTNDLVDEMMDFRL